MIGTGSQDWVELDMEMIDRRRSGELITMLVEHDSGLGAVVGGDYDLESVADGDVFVVVDGVRRFKVDINHDDRIVLTGILDPEGPL